MDSKRTMAEARVNKKDEFYTKLSTIEKEVKHYKDHFKDKVVYLNCDDPLESNFVNYFLQNFEELGLKKLLASCYREQNYNLFNMDENIESATWLEYSGEMADKENLSAKDVGVKELRGDGDFRGQESIDLLQEADIVVTNPPFSLFKEYIQQLVEYEKDFLILGNNNAITYKDFFSLIRENKVWAGHSFNKTVEFKIPDNYTEWNRINELGEKFAKVPAISWWTNIKSSSSKIKDIKLKEDYKISDYPSYSNYEAIDVNKITNMPNYDGVMGVPITFIGRYNPEQFEILGLGAGEIFKELNGTILGQEFLDAYLENGGKGNYVANQYVLGYYNDKDEPVIPYMRILIKKITKKKGEDKNE